MPPVFTKDNLPDKETSFVKWRTFRKIAPTSMFWVDGPYEVHTREGVLYRRDGWVAVDPGGYPYPIDPLIQQATYEEVDVP